MRRLPLLATVCSLLCSLLATGEMAGCSSAPANDEDGSVSEDDLKSESESFAPLDATDTDLRDAKDGTARPFEHQFTLFAIPAPKLTGLSWSTPGALARRTLINEGLGLSRGIGHVQVRIECGALGGKPAASLQVGQSSVGEQFKEMVLKEKAGLGVLFRTVDGVLETQELVERTVQERYASGRMSFLRAGISGASCHALLDYVKAYDAKDIEKNYGFVRPSFQEGSGCSAFGMSFMKLAGLTEPYMANEWRFDVNIPMTLIGGTTNPGNDVSVLRLLVLGRPWARAGEPFIRLNGWDPTLMYKSLALRAKAALAAGDSLSVEKRGRALGMVVDRQTATPMEELTNGTFFRGTPSTTDPVRFRTADF